MSNAYKVEFLSSIEDQEDLKWSSTPRRPLKGEEIARNLQQLINDHVHQGYRLQQVMDAHSRTSDKKTDMSHTHPKPDGLLVIFVKESMF
jgi:hypothetical protein